MAKYARKDILKSALDENVRYVRLQFTDMLGEIKAVEIPVAKLEDALNNKIMFDGSSIEGFVRIKESDMYLHPDVDSWLILEFEDISYGKVARLICDVYTPYGKPFPGDPRYILRRAVKKMNEMGFGSLNIGFEPEFYLFKKAADGTPTIDPSDKGSYFDMQPLSMVPNMSVAILPSNSKSWVLLSKPVTTKSVPVKTKSISNMLMS